MSVSCLSENEIEREGRRVLRRLAWADAQLAPSKADEGFALMVAGRAGLRPRMHVTAELVEAFHRRGWIAPLPSAPRCFAITDAGLGWIRRALAEGNPYAAQHRLQTRRDIAGPDGEAVSVLVNDGESPLGWLFRRKGADGRPMISETQFRAGERLRADFTLAQLTPRMAVDLSAPVLGGKRGLRAATPLSETVLAAKQRFAHALGAVGPGLSDLLIDVCCHLIGLEAAERQKGWPNRTAKIVLQIALDRLAVHYGFAPVVGAGSRIRAWQAQADENSAARES
jgi:hypothetical protein